MLGFEEVLLTPGRLLGFLPAFLTAKKSQASPRFAQREHFGLSLEHFNLDDAQASQLLRSLGPSGAAEERIGGLGRRAWTAAMVVGSMPVGRRGQKGVLPVLNRL